MLRLYYDIFWSLGCSILTASTKHSHVGLTCNCITSQPHSFLKVDLLLFVGKYDSHVLDYNSDWTFQTKEKKKYFMRSNFFKKKKIHWFEPFNERLWSRTWEDPNSSLTRLTSDMLGLLINGIYLKFYLRTYCLFRSSVCV